MALCRRRRRRRPSLCVVGRACSLSESTGGECELMGGGGSRGSGDSPLSLSSLPTSLSLFVSERIVKTVPEATESGLGELAHSHSFRYCFLSRAAAPSELASDVKQKIITRTLAGERSACLNPLCCLSLSLSLFQRRAAYIPALRYILAKACIYMYIFKSESDAAAPCDRYAAALHSSVHYYYYYYYSYPLARPGHFRLFP